MIKNKIIKLMLAVLLTFALCMPSQIEAKSIIQTRIAQIRKKYPQNSYFNETVGMTLCPRVNDGYTYWSLYECAGLVGYVTLRVYHLPYAPYGKNKYFKKVGQASIRSTKSMKKLMKKAKIGDVLEFHNKENHVHVSIFLSKYDKGVKVYEANFGTYNKVWYNHKWPYTKFKKYVPSAKSVSVYRAVNYAAVQKGTAAKNLKKNAKITVDGITYKVVSNSVNGGKVKVVSRNSSYDIPKAIGYNTTTSSKLVALGKKYKDNKYNIDTYRSLKTVAHYYETEVTYEDEQYFDVVK